MKRVEMLGLTPTYEEWSNYRVTELEARVRELEHLVHALLRDRVRQEEADAWHELGGGQGSFTPMAAVFKDRGKRMAADMDRWPEAQKWSPPAWAESED
ncbi:hypothetical protein ACQKJ1_28020 [Methylorubrum rhodesianum]|uniref:hypothetical protein n=1 Tax=Methylorubrum rhodesianum TaxID=29427 RepID=UPI003D05C677